MYLYVRLEPDAACDCDENASDNLIFSRWHIAEDTHSASDNVALLE